MDALTVALSNNPKILASGLNDVKKNHNLTLINTENSKMYKNWEQIFLNYI